MVIVMNDVNGCVKSKKVLRVGIYGGSKKSRQINGLVNERKILKRNF
jgi:hypothetical protein